MTFAILFILFLEEYGSILLWGIIFLILAIIFFRRKKKQSAAEPARYAEQEGHKAPQQYVPKERHGKFSKLNSRFEGFFDSFKDIYILFTALACMGFLPVSLVGHAAVYGIAGFGRYLLFGLFITALFLILAIGRRKAKKHFILFTAFAAINFMSVLCMIFNI